MLRLLSLAEGANLGFDGVEFLTGEDHAVFEVFIAAAHAEFLPVFLILLRLVMAALL